MVTLFYDTLRKQENRYYTQYISIVGTPNLGNDFLNLMVPLSDLNVIAVNIYINLGKLENLCIHSTTLWVLRLRRIKSLQIRFTIGKIYIQKILLRGINLIYMNQELKCTVAVPLSAEKLKPPPIYRPLHIT